MMTLFLLIQDRLVIVIICSEVLSVIVLLVTFLSGITLPGVLLEVLVPYWF
jgi:hypothetical protein